MDALPLTEATGAPYESRVPGKMHACGHDGHVAIGLAVAERLSRAPCASRFRFLFQPAEEGAGGAEACVATASWKGSPRPSAFTSGTSFRSERSASTAAR